MQVVADVNHGKRDAADEVWLMRMRVATLSDVHGNLAALDAVLADVVEAGVDSVVFTGDVALGPFPDATLERLMWTLVLDPNALAHFDTVPKSISH